MSETGRGTSLEKEKKIYGNANIVDSILATASAGRRLIFLIVSPGHYGMENLRGGGQDLHNFISSGFVTLGRGHLKGNVGHCPRGVFVSEPSASSVIGSELAVNARPVIVSPQRSTPWTSWVRCPGRASWTCPSPTVRPRRTHTSSASGEPLCDDSPAPVSVGSQRLLESPPRCLYA